MLVECSHCGAPLDVQPGAILVGCAYCNRKHRVPGMRTIAPETPADFRPPEVWTPPQEAAAESRALHFHAVRVVAGTVWTIGRAMLLVALLFAGIAGVVWFQIEAQRRAHQLAEREAVARGREMSARALSQVGEALRGADAAGKLGEAAGRLGEAAGKFGAAALSGFGWNGEEPLVCDGNRHMTVEGVSATLPGRTAIEARNNCHLRVVGCTLDAWEAIAVGGNAHVVVEGSTLRAKGRGISVEANGHLELFDTTLVAGEVAVEAGGNADVVLGSGRVEGEVRALQLRANAEAEVREAELVGGVKGRRSRIRGL